MTTLAAGAVDGRQARIGAELMTALQGNLLGIGIGNGVVASALVVGLWGALSPTLLLPWLALQLLHSAFSIWAWWRVRGRAASVRSAARRARASVWASAGSGLLWAAAVVLFWPPDRLDLQLLIITMITGLVSGAVHSLCGHMPAFLAFYLPNVAAVVGMCLWQTGTLHAMIAITAAAYGVTGARFARAMHRVQRNAILHREDLAELAADLALQKDRAERASSSKSRFLAAASHDIRQPVHALNLFLGAFDAQSLQGRNAELIGLLRDSAGGLREMLDSVLDLSRADAGAVEVNAQPLPVQVLLDVLERDFATLAQARGLVLRTVPSRLWVQADRVLAGRILRNLVSNGLRYTQRGGVLIGARRRGDAVSVEVWDTGSGIDPGERGLIFEEFQRGARAAGVERSGLGLGLAIARRFADAQGAGLSLDSTPGRGSVFRLRLPMAPAAVGGVAPVPVSVQGRVGLGGLQVLVVDDDPMVVRATRALLVDWGCEVRTADHPTDVPRAVRGWHPQLLITDHDFGGQHAAGEVWRLAAVGGSVACIVVAGDGHAPSLQPLRDAGALVLAKPVDPAELQAVLVRLSGRPRS